MNRTPMSGHARTERSGFSDIRTDMAPPFRGQCPVSGPEEYEVVWSGALDRLGLCPRLVALPECKPHRADLLDAQVEREPDPPSQPEASERPAASTPGKVTPYRRDPRFRFGFASDKKDYVNGLKSTTYGDLS
jgi:hypothetical protein